MVFSTTWLEFKDMAQIHWSDESRFPLHVTDGRMRVWRHEITVYTPRNWERICFGCNDNIHQLGCLVWWLNPACSHERYTPNHYWASTVRDRWLNVLISFFDLRILVTTLVSSNLSYLDCIYLSFAVYSLLLVTHVSGDLVTMTVGTKF
jgi:hypothetical protein